MTGMPIQPNVPSNESSYVTSAKTSDCISDDHHSLSDEFSTANQQGNSAEKIKKPAPRFSLDIKKVACFAADEPEQLIEEVKVAKNNDSISMLTAIAEKEKKVVADNRNFPLTS